MSPDRKRIAKRFARRGNGTENGGRRTVCTVACLDFLGVPRGTYRYAHSISDIVRLARRAGYSVRSRKSAAGKRACTSIGKLRERIRSGAMGDGFFIVRVPEHAMILDANGRTVVDTDPRKRDARRITHVYLAKRT